MAESSSPAFDLTGRVAFITGGTRGLGRAIAAKLVSCGCEVYLNYATADDDAAAAAAALLGPGTAHVARGDVTAQGVLPELLTTVADRHCGIDIFVHNVGRLRPGPVLALDRAELHANLAVTLEPLVAALPVLAKAMVGRPGRVVAVSSAGAGRVVPGYVGPGVAKAALESLVRYAAVELAPQATTVNAVSTAKLDKGDGTGDQQRLTALAARTPGGRLTVTADVADAVALLCTDEAAWIQGQVLVVDGGFGLPA